MWHKYTYCCCCILCVHFVNVSQGIICLCHIYFFIKSDNLRSIVIFSTNAIINTYLLSVYLLNTFSGKVNIWFTYRSLRNVMYSCSCSCCCCCCCSGIFPSLNISGTICPIGLRKVPKEASRWAGFNGAHNFGVTTPPGGENWH